MNKFIVVGRVGKVTVGEGDKPKATFTIAVDAGYTDRNTNEWVDRTNWFFIQTYYPKLVEMVSKAVAKGDLLTLEGELEPWKKETDSGNKTGINLNLQSFKRLLRPKSDTSSDEA